MSKIVGKALPDMPWQDKDENDKLPVWRYKANPIIDRFATRNSNSIFNSAVVPFEDGYAGIFRCDSRSISMDIFAGFSKDGIHWDISDDPIVFHCDDEEIGKRDYRYDPRVCFIEDRYYITWCNGYHGYPTIGVGYTFDFKTFYQLENAFLPFNRNGVLFPRKINGNYYMLSRPSDNGHTPFGDIFVSESPDTCSRLVGVICGLQAAIYKSDPTPYPSLERSLCPPAAEIRRGVARQWRLKIYILSWKLRLMTSNWCSRLSLVKFTA